MLVHQASVSITHDETGKSYGVWRGKSGGGLAGENALIRPGGMSGPVAQPGTSALEELSASRWLKHGTDSGLVQELKGLHGERFTIVIQRLDSKGQPGFHKPETWSGLLNGCTSADVDADSNDPVLVEATFTVDTFV